MPSQFTVEKVVGEQECESAHGPPPEDPDIAF